MATTFIAPVFHCHGMINLRTYSICGLCTHPFRQITAEDTSHSDSIFVAAALLTSDFVESQIKKKHITECFGALVR